MTLRDELRSFKRERIIEEAQRLFYERGYRGTSLDAVAEALDMTKPFVYAVYARKVDILVEISMRTLQRSLDTLRQARADGGSPTAQLQRFAMRFTEVIRRAARCSFEKRPRFRPRPPGASTGSRASSTTNWLPCSRPAVRAGSSALTMYERPRSPSAA